MGRAAAARRSIRRPTARPSQRPQAATDPPDLAIDAHTRPQARQTRPTSTSRPRIEASAKTRSPSDRALSPDGLSTRYTPHKSHRRPHAWHSRPLRPRYDTSSGLETATTRCAPSPIGAVAEVARDRSGDATTALGRSLDIVATLLGAGEQRRGHEERRTWTEEFSMLRCAPAAACWGASGTYSSAC